MKKGVYPGSFDPITNGHIDVIRRAARFADELYVAVLINTAKKYMFTTEERVEMLKESVGDIENVRCISYSGLLVDFCREYEIDAIIFNIPINVMNMVTFWPFPIIELPYSDMHSIASSRIILFSWV